MIRYGVAVLGKGCAILCGLRLVSDHLASSEFSNITGLDHYSTVENCELARAVRLDSGVMIATAGAWNLGQLLTGPRNDRLTMIARLTIWVGVAAFLAACVETPPPRSVAEFLENPIVLEAALVRCAQNRAETRYDAECVNAREANKVVAAREEAARRAAFEAQSERKRQALRRAQEAAAEARRRAEEAKRRREEAEYLSQFGQVPPAEPESPEQDIGNEPLAVIPEPEEESVSAANGNEGFGEPLSQPVPGAGNAPTAETEAPQDLSDIRDELRRRNED